MKLPLQLIFTAVFFFTGFISNAQNPATDANYFRNPLAIPIELSANFGEVRRDHYHMGLDIRTQQRENLPVYAAADGYVSRISVKRGGFGRAIYITHPAGYTTVYAHLNRYYDELENYLVQQQYAAETWSFDKTLQPDQFPVKKGQFIAYSGNTGGSEGPHLHFEVRNTKTDNNINPLLFRLGVPDNIPPVISSLYWYDRRYSTYQVAPAKIAIKKVGNGYTTTSPVQKIGSRFLSLGVVAKDKTNNSPFYFGMYSADVWMDDSLHFSFKIDSVSYANTSYVNAGIDYASYIRSRIEIQHLSRLPGNILPFFTGEDDGVLYLRDDNPHTVTIRIRDIAGNETQFQSQLQYDASLQQDLFFTQQYQKLLPNQVNDIVTDNVKLRFGPMALYDMVPFVLSYTENRQWPNASVTAQLHGNEIPVQNSYDISLKLNNPAYSIYRDRMVIKMENPKYGSIAKATTQDGAWYKASFSKLGNVTLLVDTVKPVINMISNNVISTKGAIRIRTSDNSGIKNFTGILDSNQWLLFSNATSDYLYTVDEHCPAGDHTLTITVEDIAGNIAIKQFNISVRENLPAVKSKTTQSGKKTTNGSSTKRRK
ncbi:MAG: M23 family metallopeptidase [Filimonas sp.]|nr:M23 family metallopeptidase [Filimonas sp.]